MLDRGPPPRKLLPRTTVEKPMLARRSVHLSPVARYERRAFLWHPGGLARPRVAGARCHHSFRLRAYRHGRISTKPASCGSSVTRPSGMIVPKSGTVHLTLLYRAPAASRRMTARALECFTPAAPVLSLASAGIAGPWPAPHKARTHRAVRRDVAANAWPRCSHRGRGRARPGIRTRATATEVSRVRRAAPCVQAANYYKLRKAPVVPSICLPSRWADRYNGSARFPSAEMPRPPRA